MRVSFLLFLVTCVTTVTGQYLIIRENLNATFVHPEDTVHECFQFDISPKIEKPVNLTSFIQSVCTHDRSKRISFSTTGVLAKLGLPFVYHFFRADMKKAKKLTEEKDLFVEQEVKRYRELLQMPPIEMKDFLSAFEMNTTELLEQFQFPIDALEDLWPMIDHKSIHCRSSETKLALTACGPVNPDREWGTLNTVVSIGKFSSRGTIYKSLDLPEHAVLIGGILRSATSCRLMSTFYECIAPKDLSCGVDNYENCTETAVFTPTKVFVKNYTTPYTVVASQIETYATNINEVYSHHRMDISQHVVLALPIGSYALFNGIKVYGRATSDFDHFAVHHEAIASPIDEADLEALEEQTGGHEEIREHRALISTKPESSGSTVSLFTWSIPLSIVLLAFVVVALLKSGEQTRNVSNGSAHFSRENDEVTLNFDNSSTNPESVV